MNDLTRKNPINGKIKPCNYEMKTHPYTKVKMKLNVFCFALTSVWHSVNGKQETPLPTNSPTVTQVLTTSAASSVCTGNAAGWVDSAGDGCDWYEANDLPGCPYHGHSFDGGMGVADDNCCFCAGTGAPTSPVQYPTYSPTVTHVPTMSAAPSACMGNTVGWVDSFGGGCDWYEAYDLPGCPYYGDVSVFDGGMGVADDNCCFCAGTGAPSPPVQYPTYPPATGALITPFPTSGDEISR